MDTSVVWTALAHPYTVPGRVIDRWYKGSEFTLIWTDDILTEYRRTLLSSEYIDVYGKQEEVDDFLTLVEIFGEHVKPAPDELLPVVRDRYDRMWLAASIGGATRFLVTYDNDFLQHPELVRAMRDRGTRIVRPANFHRELDQLVD